MSLNRMKYHQKLSKFVTEKWNDRDCRGTIISILSVAHFAISFGILLSFGEFIPVFKGELTKNETSLGL